MAGTGYGMGDRAQVRSRVAVFLERCEALTEGPLDRDTLARLVAAERQARREWGQSLPRQRRNLRPVYQGEE